MLKKITIISAILLCFLIGWNWSILSYGIEQGKGQLEVILNAQPIEFFINNPEYPDSLKKKLNIIQEARIFAVDKLGLNDTDNYTTMYDQKGLTLLWNLSASEPFQLKPYLWSFPFLGEMPYKGFFEKKYAVKEKALLDSLGYDSRIRPVSGWSTLGILQDPILSNMLKRSDGALAELIIHELTHATLFVKNDIDFNENLASFIGEMGAIIFLTEKNNCSEQLKEYTQSEEDSRLFREHLLRGTTQLDSLYNKFTAADPIELKTKNKKHFIEQIVNTLDTVSFNNPNYKSIFKNGLPNNAYFMSLKRYHSQKDTLESLFQKHDRNIKTMISALKTTYGK